MPRYAAILRGVMPTNAKMPELKRAFEAAGFTAVKTVLGSGNVVFDARPAAPESLERKAQAAMKKTLGREFMTFVRSIEALEKMLASNLYRGIRLAPDTKRIVTFLREAPRGVKLPIEQDNAHLLRVEGGVLFSAYEPTDKGPVFMTLILKNFGKDQTTRTWLTIEKIVRA